jgi:hypothetical protein
MRGNVQGDLFDDQVVIPSLEGALTGLPSKKGCHVETSYYSAPEVDLALYDHVIVCLSGGKDSIAAYLRLLDMGVDRSKVEFWHHDVDGREGSSLMDWGFMRDYCNQLAEVFQVPLYFSWLEGGFEGELLKDNAYSRPHHVETPEGLLVLPRDHQRASPSTRLRFPQQSPSLQTRWCSSALKIDVGRRALNNQDRFRGKKILFVTGERREESANRAKFNQLEAHACDRRNGRTARRVDAWRPVLHWTEELVWEVLEKHRVSPPVPYRLGWSRSSCMTCIYNSPRVWATIKHYWPERVMSIARYEQSFGVTVSRKRIDVLDLSAGVSPIRISDVDALNQVSMEQYVLPVLVPAGQKWETPPGAFGREACGSD